MELESILLPGVEDKRPMVIAGPCSAETEEQVMSTATQLAAKGVKIFRAGIWKPRTKPVPYTKWILPLRCWSHGRTLPS